MDAKQTCKEVRIHMMGLLDNEISGQKKEALLKHIANCPSCKKEYETFKALKRDTKDMKLKKLPEIYWDDYWTQVYNRMERGLSWVLISIGIMILLVYGGFEVMRDFFLDPQKPLLLKIGTGALSVGMIVLFISVLREKLMIRKIDKYRSVER